MCAPCEVITRQRSQHPLLTQSQESTGATGVRRPPRPAPLRAVLVPVSVLQVSRSVSATIRSPSPPPSRVGRHLLLFWGEANLGGGGPSCSLSASAMARTPSSCCAWSLTCMPGFPGSRSVLCFSLRLSLRASLCPGTGWEGRWLTAAK